MILKIFLARGGQGRCTTPKGLIVMLFMAATVAVAASDVWSASPSADPQNTAADRILVEKAKRTLTLYRDGKLIKAYRIALGKNPVGPKVQEGDGRTPEGRYMIVGRKADSAYHRALRISYPNAADRTRAKALGVSPGGDIMIRGGRKSSDSRGALRRPSDWTRGCIAVTNGEIEEIWKMAPDGTAVEIVP